MRGTSRLCVGRVDHRGRLGELKTRAWANCRGAAQTRAEGLCARRLAGGGGPGDCLPADPAPAHCQARLQVLRRGRPQRQDRRRLQGRGSHNTDMRRRLGVVPEPAARQSVRLAHCRHADRPAARQCGSRMGESTRGVPPSRPPAGLVGSAPGRPAGGIRALYARWRRGCPAGFAWRLVVRPIGCARSWAWRWH